MAQLLEQSIKTLYQGVSRQPDAVRLPGQVEEAENVQFSVVTGGFTSRPSTSHVCPLPELDAVDNVGVHSYVRDETEQYIIIVKNGGVQVLDLQGNQYTVNKATSDNWNYLSASDPATAFSFATIGDVTIIANNEKVVSMGATPATPTSYKAVIWPRTTNSNVTYKIVIAGTTRYTKAVTTALSNTQIGDDIYNTITLPTGMTKSRVGNSIVLSSTTDFSISVVGSDFTYGPVVNKDVLPYREHLSPEAPNGFKIKLGKSLTADGYWAQFSTTHGGWIETADPTIANGFDLTTMPHTLTRNADGTFTFDEGTWEARAVGDDETAPKPDFVGDTIKDLVFHRNRLALVAGETVTFSQSGKYFNMWPQYITQVLDDDSFGVTASSTSVNNIQFGVAFRKSLFLAAPKTQFEVSAPDVLTPKTTSVDLSTSYATEVACRPVTMGNLLYFASRMGKDAMLFEYTYDYQTVSNVATDVTMHVLGYIPAPVVRMTADSASNMLFVLSDKERNAIYNYTTYIDGDRKAQSAWGKWTFGDDATIMWMGVVDAALYMVIRRGQDTFLEAVRLRYDLGDQGHPFRLSMDRQTLVDGVYNAEENYTYYTLPFYIPTQVTSQVTTYNGLTVPLNTVEGTYAVLSTEFGSGEQGTKLNIEFVPPDDPNYIMSHEPIAANFATQSLADTAKIMWTNLLIVPQDVTTTVVPHMLGYTNRVRVFGDYAGIDNDLTVIFGTAFKSSVVLSNIFYRDPASPGKTTVSGRLQLRRMTFNYRDTGYFKVGLTPQFREQQQFTFNGKLIGSGTNTVGAVAIERRGAFKVPARGRADATSIEIFNDSEKPFTITSIDWAGVFNEITRQG